MMSLSVALKEKQPLGAVDKRAVSVVLANEFNLAYRAEASVYEVLEMIGIT